MGLSQAQAENSPAGPALWALRHPVAAWSLILVLAALGVAAVFRTPLVPPALLSAPVITVTAENPGVPAPLLTAAVTQPLERALADIAGMERLSVRQRDGRVELDLWFRERAALERARAALPARLAAVAAELPATVTAPRIEPDNRTLAAEVVVSSAAHDPIALRNWVESAFAHQLIELPSVAGLRIEGGASHSVVVQPNLRRLTALGLSLEDLVATLRRGADHLAAAESGAVPAVAALSVPLPGGDNLALSELARVQAVAVPSAELDQHDGVGAIRVLVFKQHRSSHIETADAVRARIAWMRANRQIPDALRAEVLPGAAAAMKRGARRFLTIEVTSLLTCLVIGGLAFRFRRPALLLAATLPAVALITIAALAWRYGGIDSVLLGALLIGLVPALLPALVMYLRITRAGGGESRDQATAAGQRSLLRIAALWLAALVPLWWLGGATGIILGELVWSVSIVGGVAVVCGLLLVPAALAPWPRFAPMRQRRGIVERAAQWFDSALRAALTRPWFALAVAVSPWVVAAAVAPSVMARADLITPFARDELVLRDTGPAADRVLAARVAQLAVRLRSVGGVESVVGAHAVDESGGRTDYWLRLYPVARSARGIRALETRVQAALATAGYGGSYPLMTAIFPGTVADAAASPWHWALQGELGLRIIGPDRERLAQHAQQLLAGLDGVAGLTGVRRRAGPMLSDLTLVLDPERSAEHAVDAASAARAVHIARHGLRVADLLEGDRQIAVRVVLAARDRAALERLPLHGETAERPVVFLGDVGRVETRARVAEWRRENQQPAVEIVAMPSGAQPLARLRDSLARAAATLTLAPGESWSLSGAAALLAESTRQLAWAGGTSLILLVMTLLWQSRSWRKTAAILVAPAWALAAFLVTLSLPGQVVSLWVWPAMLVALAVSTALGALAVAAVDARRARGQSWLRAIAQGARAQLRPALVIAAVAVSGLAPLALGLARGFEWIVAAAAGLLAAVIVGLIAAAAAVPLSYYFIGVAAVRGKLPRGRQE